ncbi:hypothetical protein MiSe_11750 [Microseira wollei NIES-4236]|uniref:Transposase n=1 Tax=Microseira wollei NIES-4236 TaxID=2530354 RepID=A0AAV3X2Z5_9CYAN|nr:hypothetical protein MiSe_11750 [Microseira wollei NIES-4236]
MVRADWAKPVDKTTKRPKNHQEKSPRLCGKSGDPGNPSNREWDSFIRHLHRGMTSFCWVTHSGLSSHFNPQQMTTYYRCRCENLASPQAKTARGTTGKIEADTEMITYGTIHQALLPRCMVKSTQLTNSKTLVTLTPRLMIKACKQGVNGNC